MDFTPTKTQSTLESAIAAIRSYIIDNSLMPGDVLPTETRLAGELGISRNILREAMQHYRTLGIVITKPKVGATVAQLLPTNPYENYLPFLAAESATILPELAEVRYSIETGSAEFMVRHATRGDLAKLSQLLEQLEAETTYSGMRGLDIKFHQGLLESTHNSILLGLIPLLVNFFSEMSPPAVGGDRLDEEKLQRITREHRAIIRSLAARNADALRQELAVHIGGYIKSVSRKERIDS